MKITWLGQSCFLFENKQGQRLVCDPFNPAIGYPAPHVKADVVTISHGHHDHNATEQLIGSPYIKQTLEREALFGYTISGIASYHDNEQGAQRGPNIIFIGETDGLRFAHCGDLGHTLSPEQIAAIGKLDILLIPVGSVYTLDGAEAAKVVTQLKPKLTIPMHFKTPTLEINLRPVTDFLEHNPQHTLTATNNVLITKENINEFAPVLVLAPPQPK